MTEGEKDRIIGILNEKLQRYRTWAARDLLNTGELSPRVQQKLRVAVPNILAALEAIKNGTYGICVDCGEPIPVKRMMAVPGATRCVHCLSEASHAQCSA